jgi:hypothetical protein
MNDRLYPFVLMVAIGLVLVGLALLPTVGP